MVQDPSFIHEVLAYRLFGAMGVPAPGTGYAKVRLNGADLGLYLVLEAQDDVFASRNYGGTGHLYEGEYGQDLVPSQVDFLQLDEGNEDGRADLQALVAAANLEGDGWYEALGQVADLPELVKMWAVEQYIGHWDGYAPTINNYWVHSDDQGRFTMWPGGTDQTFADARDYFQGYALLFGRCMTHAQCRQDYERALGLLLQVVPVLGLEEQAQALMTQLSDAVLWDPRKEVSHEDFLWGVQATIDFLLGRKTNLAEAIGCLLDENADKDGDGYVCDQDCDENDKATHVGAAEICGDDRDQDCSGVADDGLDCPDCDDEWRGPHRYLFCTNRRNFADADAHCQEYGSKLVVADGPYEDLWLRQAMDRRGFGECWLGISDEALEGVWMTVTGTAQQFFSWADGEPNNCCGGENCGEYWAWGRWNDVSCLDANPVVCEDTCPEGLDSDGDDFGRCDEDCDDDRGDVFPGAPENCFDGVDQDCNGLPDDTGCWTCEELASSQGQYLLCPYGGGLQAAKDYCANWGGKVLVINDDGENYWVKTTLVNSGLDRVWLGISDGTSEGQWADLDGEEITFSAWGNGEPNNSGGNEDCANLYTNGFWNDLPCNGNHPVICEKP
jgi:hypothetical protein